MKLGMPVYQCVDTWLRFRRPYPDSTAGQVNGRNEVVSGLLWFSPYSLIFSLISVATTDGE